MFLSFMHYSDEKICIDKFEVGSFGNNCYIVSDPATNEAVIIDAAFEPETIVEHAHGLKVTRILTTHGHGDHVAALAETKEILGTEAGCHEADVSMMPVPPDFLIKDGEQIQVGNITLSAMHTPGHTPGGLCFVFENHLFSGDTLFPGGPGNTRQPLGNFELIIKSIKDQLFVFPDDTNVYPGHGLNTTIGTERPHLQEWVDRGW